MRLLALFLLFCTVFTTNAQTETENNNSFSTANVINSIPSSIEGKIGEKDDVDFFKFEINQSGALETRITNIDPNCKLEASLYDGNQNLITSTREYDANTPLKFNKRICTNGVYYLKINAIFSKESDQLYNLSINLDTEDTFECNDSFQNAADVNLGQDIQAKIKEEDDLDFFKFEINQSGVLETRITNIDPNHTLEASLFDSDQNLIISTREYDAGAPLKFNKRICTNGIYYLKITSLFGKESDQLYNLSINLDTKDIYECNDSFQNATEIDLCNDYKISLNTYDDIDYFSFKISSSDTLTIQLKEIPYYKAPYLKIYDKDRDIIEEYYLDQGEDNSFTFIPAYIGDYYLSVEHRSYSSEYGSDLFKFKISNIGCGTTSTSDYETDNNITIAPNPATEFIKIQSKGSNKIQQVKLFDTSGKLLGNYTNDSEINISQYPIGIILVQFITENGIITKKIIKQ